MNSNCIKIKKYSGFALLKNDSSPEARAIYFTQMLDNFSVLRLDKKDKCPEGYVPCGSVEWCLSILGKNITPNYYPNFLQNHLYRNVWREEKWPLGKKVFIKPADRFKRFTGFETTGTYKKKKKGPFWCSQVIHFVNEWRYYITAGEVVASGWYWRDQENTPDPPEFKIKIPKTFYGTLDFGLTVYNEFALVEAHPPFACGWYGTDHQAYTQWLLEGWDYLKRRDE